MEEFQKQADEIARVINEKNTGKMNIAELSKITIESVGHEVNCYPGIPGVSCHEGAYFYSLKGKYSGTRGLNLSLYVVLSKIVQHMIGACEGETKYAVLITDNWNDNTYSSWKSTFEKIRKNYHIEVYLMTSGKCNKIKI
ncbi:MAG: hypothetical protein KAH72_07200 [Flavobacteriaceae bacterium]|nr:hypothetical protein [Flavobacteriaceae bacterium]